MTIPAIQESSPSIHSSIDETVPEAPNRKRARSLTDEFFSKLDQDLSPSAKCPKTVHQFPIKKEPKIAAIQKERFDFFYDEYTYEQCDTDPRMLEIFCAACPDVWIADYQADGKPGKLHHCFVDRIYHPSQLRKNTFTSRTLDKISNLICPNCKSILATPFIHYKDHRPAYKINKNYAGRSKIVYRHRL